jgi:hypothetical protein
MFTFLGGPAFGIGGGNPSAAPVRDSIKSHVAKPDPFKDRRDFYKFI